MKNSPQPAWKAVVSIALGVAGLIIAEFLPTGMLTPMAADLGITRGMAGQAVTATSFFAVLASLLTAYLTRRLDRRVVLLGLSVLLVASNGLVAASPNFTVLLAGRVLLGISLGGFWSMAAATAMRLVPESEVPKAIALIFGASSFASVLAAPLSSYLGGLIGWRTVFLLAASFSFAALAMQFWTLPSLPPRGKTELGTLGKVLQIPQFAGGMLAVALVFCGHFAAFTYVRPFLESTTQVGAGTLPAILLMFGIANFVGTSLAGVLIKQNFRLSLYLLPALLAPVAIGFVAFGKSAEVAATLVFFWGILVGPVSVVWSTWVARKAPEHAETAGGIFIASIQLAAAVGAMCGGAAFDAWGSPGVFALSSASWLLSALVAMGVARSFTGVDEKPGALGIHI